MDKEYIRKKLAELNQKTQVERERMKNQVISPECAKVANENVRDMQFVQMKCMFAGDKENYSISKMFTDPEYRKAVYDYYSDKHEDTQEEKEIFAEWLSSRKDRIYESARNNTKYNEEGKPTISKDDSWFYEDEWDKPNISESIAESFKQIKLHKEGKLKLKSYKESMKEWKEWAGEVE